MAEDSSSTRSAPSFGPNLRAARKRRGLTQEQLVAIAGVSSISLSRLEGGVSKPTFDMLIKLADALGESPDRLIGWRDPDRPTDDREALLRQLDSVAADLSKEWVEALLAMAALARGK